MTCIKTNVHDRGNWKSWFADHLIFATETFSIHLTYASYAVEDQVLLALLPLWYQLWNTARCVFSPSYTTFPQRCPGLHVCPRENPVQRSLRQWIGGHWLDLSDEELESCVCFLYVYVCESFLLLFMHTSLRHRLCKLHSFSSWSRFNYLK